MSNKSVGLELDKALERYYGQPKPAASFVAQLERRLLSQSEGIIESHRRPIWLGQPRTTMLFRFSALAFGLILTVAIAIGIIGPQRVWAAAQGFLGYIPGIGIVDIDNGLVLSKPIEQNQNGVILRVDQLIATAKNTTLIYSISGLSEGEDVVPAYLQLPDGTKYFGQDRMTEADEDNSNPSPVSLGFHVSEIMWSLPKGITDVKVIWERRHQNLGQVFETWIVPIHLQPLTDELRAQLFPTAYTPPNAQLTRPALTIQVLQVAPDPTGKSTVIRLSYQWHSGEIQTVFFDTANLQDENGKVYSQKYLQVLMDADAQPVISSSTSTLDFEPIDPKAKRLSLSLDGVGIRAIPTDDMHIHKVHVDLGANPKIGLVVPLDDTFQVAGQSVHIRGAQVVEKLDQGTSFPVLELLVDPLPAVGELSLRALSVYGGDDSRPMTFIPNGIKLTDYQLRTGTVSVYIDYAELVFTNSWKLTWDIPRTTSVP